MSKFISTFVAAFTALISAASAAPITVVNSNFEIGDTLTQVSPAHGAYDFLASGWTVTGEAGTFEPHLSDTSVFLSAPAEIGSRIGFVNPGASMYQLLAEVISPSTDYTLSALFGDRVTLTAGGSFGFFAGDPSNIIATQTVSFPGEGIWGAQSFTLDTAFLVNYVGQQLGIIFFGGGTQLNIDNIFVDAVNVGGQVIENPLPGAVWLFGSALLAGGIFKRRKKKSA